MEVSTDSEGEEEEDAWHATAQGDAHEDLQMVCTRKSAGGGLQGVRSFRLDCVFQFSFIIPLGQDYIFLVLAMRRVKASRCSQSCICVVGRVQELWARTGCHQFCTGAKMCTDTYIKKKLGTPGPRCTSYKRVALLSRSFRFTRHRVCLHLTSAIHKVLPRYLHTTMCRGDSDAPLYCDIAYTAGAVMAGLYCVQKGAYGAAARVKTNMIVISYPCGLGDPALEGAVVSLWTWALLEELGNPIPITTLLEKPARALHAKGQRPWMVVTPGKAYSLATCVACLLSMLLCML
jgi:hypothetical protein